MTTMVTEVYDALRDAGVGDDKAKRAAEAMASCDPQLARIRSDLRVLKWQVGALFAITGPTLLLLLRVAGKVGALAF